jgi:hypothetical protein
MLSPAKLITYPCGLGPRVPWQFFWKLGSVVTVEPKWSLEGVFPSRAVFKVWPRVTNHAERSENIALKKLQKWEDERSMRWKCKDCEYVKHFTRPVTLEAAGRCPDARAFRLRLCSSAFKSLCHCPVESKRGTIHQAKY